MKIHKPHCYFPHANICKKSRCSLALGEEIIKIAKCIFYGLAAIFTAFFISVAGAIICKTHKEE